MQLSQTMPTAAEVSYADYKAKLTERAEKTDVMDKQAFLNLLVTQLKNQDPLSPMDNADFTAQTTSFSQLEQLISMNKSLESLLSTQSTNTSDYGILATASNVIGKTIEYDTNILSVSEDGVTPISFYSSDVAVSAAVSIYNADQELVGNVNLTDIKKGANAFPWDGTGMGGAALPKGSYYFTVSAKNAEGNPVTIGSYGEGVVTGAKSSNGELYYEVQGKLVPAESVYSVKETAN
jgi:flagellar basal-body rod modification protein FlgD